jgi:hypothetical protein
MRFSGTLQELEQRRVRGLHLLGEGFLPVEVRVRLALTGAAFGAGRRRRARAVPPQWRPRRLRVDRGI